MGTLTECPIIVGAVIMEPTPAGFTAEAVAGATAPMLGGRNPEPPAPKTAPEKCPGGGIGEGVQEFGPDKARKGVADIVGGTKCGVG